MRETGKKDLEKRGRLSSLEDVDMDQQHHIVLWTTLLVSLLHLIIQFRYYPCLVLCFIYIIIYVCYFEII